MSRPGVWQGDVVLKLDIKYFRYHRLITTWVFPVIQNKYDVKHHCTSLRSLIASIPFGKCYEWVKTLKITVGRDSIVTCASNCSDECGILVIGGAIHK